MREHPIHGALGQWDEKFEASFARALRTEFERMPIQGDEAMPERIRIHAVGRLRILLSRIVDEEEMTEVIRQESTAMPPTFQETISTPDETQFMLQGHLRPFVPSTEDIPVLFDAADVFRKELWPAGNALDRRPESHFFMSMLLHQSARFLTEEEQQRFIQLIEAFDTFHVLPAQGKLRENQDWETIEKELGDFFHSLPQESQIKFNTVFWWAKKYLQYLVAMVTANPEWENTNTYHEPELGFVTVPSAEGSLKYQSNVMWHANSELFNRNKDVLWNTLQSFQFKYEDVLRKGRRKE